MIDFDWFRHSPYWRQLFGPSRASTLDQRCHISTFCQHFRRRKVFGQEAHPKMPMISSLVRTTIEKVKSKTVGFLKSWAPSSVRGRLWDEEFRAGHWNYLESTSDDYVYSFLNRYARRGSILDLGCGSGNTGNELGYKAYSFYLGIDISREAIERARIRSERNGRLDKNRYDVGDIESFTPPQRFDVILFRESLHYLPLRVARTALSRYSDFLTDSGAFIVRLCDRDKRLHLIRSIRQEYEILEDAPHSETGAIVVVFRPVRKGIGEEAS